MKILFERSANSYLPEVSAYRKFLKRFQDVTSFELRPGEQLQEAEFDVVWRFPGVLPRRDLTFTVHEYNSLSTAPFAKIKDQAKRLFNSRPDFRVFLNQEVEARLHFKDDIGYSIRDMGVDQSFFEAAAHSRRQKKEHHLVYMGSLTKSRGVDAFIRSVALKKHRMKILLIGEPHKELYEEFKGNRDVVFAGRVPQAELPKLAMSAIAGLNFLPDVYPYNIQTSTKLIEYCALGMGVVSSRYEWVEDFARRRGGRLLWLDRSDKGLSSSFVEKFEFLVPNVDDLEWNSVIERSGIFDRVFSAIGYHPGNS